MHFVTKHSIKKFTPRAFCTVYELKFVGGNTLIFLEKKLQSWQF